MYSNELRSLFIFVAVIIAIGTVFYMIVEQWSFVDAYYFSVMTLTTVGYGDVTPVTTLGKLFTTLYVFGGLGIVFAFIQTLATQQTKKPFAKRNAKQNRKQ